MEIINSNKKRIKLRLRKYKYDIITFVFGVAMLLVSIYFYDSKKYLAIISFIILLISLPIYIFLRTKEKDFYFLPLNKPGDEKDWIGVGDFKFVSNEKSFLITNSNVGYIFSKTSGWSDYKYETDFKIIDHCVSWIIRATNLSNYIMFQCGIDKISPHIRFSGQWILLDNKGLVFTNNLSKDNWYRSVIVCEKRMIRIKIYSYKDKTFVFDRHWGVPESLMVELPTTAQRSLNYKFVQNNANRNNEENIYINQIIDFDFGSTGLRNWGPEKGLVKNIFIEKL